MTTAKLGIRENLLIRYLALSLGSEAEALILKYENVTDFLKAILSVPKNELSERLESDSKKISTASKTLKISLSEIKTNGQAYEVLFSELKKYVSTKF